MGLPVFVLIIYKWVRCYLYTDSFLVACLQLPRITPCCIPFGPSLKQCLELVIPNDASSSSSYLFTLPLEPSLSRHDTSRYQFASRLPDGFPEYIVLMASHKSVTRNARISELPMATHWVKSINFT